MTENHSLVLYQIGRLNHKAFVFQKGLTQFHWKQLEIGRQQNLKMATKSANRNKTRKSQRKQKKT